ncbi:MAG: hypothetical protein ACOC92_01200 [bacterium]
MPTIQRDEFSVEEFQVDGQVKGATARFPRDPEAVHLLQEAFPKAFWSKAGQGWFLRGKTARRRLERWAEEHLPAGDPELTPKLHEEETAEPLPLPHRSKYHPYAHEYVLDLPYDDELVRMLKTIPRAAWDPKSRVWRVHVRSRAQLAETLPALQERLAELAHAKALETARSQERRRERHRTQATPSDQPRTTTARYASTCNGCGGPIQPGQRIVSRPDRPGSTHAECDQLEPGPIRLRGGSGYGASGWRRGQVLRNTEDRIEAGEPRYLTILTAGSKYYAEDGMSFGVGAESGHVYWATAREATAEEAAELRNRDALARDVHEALEAVRALRERVHGQGERPQPGPDDPDGLLTPEGERLLDTHDPYGGGDWWVVGSRWIWYVRNNGMDGDDWSQNNVRTGGAGAIGWRIPYDSEADATLRRAVQAIADLETGRPGPFTTDLSKPT